MYAVPEKPTSQLFLKKLPETLRLARAFLLIFSPPDFGT
jgi:hypothetical protein